MKVKPVKLDKARLSAVSVEHRVEEVYKHSIDSGIIFSMSVSDYYRLTVSANDSAGLPKWIKNR